MAPSARIETFEFDVLETAEDGKEPLDLSRLPAPMAVIFHRRANVRRVRVFRANQQTTVLLQLCTGTVNVQSICERLHSTSSGDASQVFNKCSLALNALQASGLVLINSKRPDGEYRDCGLLSRSH
jgi:hypothetical protein